VSFAVKQGEVLGIIGRNGAGKSTLLKILSRVTAPTSGLVKIKGRIASLLEIGTGFHPELTGRENIYLNGTILGMRKAEVARKFDEIVAFAEIEKFIDTPVKRYSSGMYVRLAFAVAAHLEPEILLVDEVLAVGDAAFQKKCLGKMGDVAREGRTVLFVSHNMAAIEHLCAKGLVFEKGEVDFVGTADQAVAVYEDKLFSETNIMLQAQQPHIIFQKSSTAPHLDLEIVKIELLDSAHQPKPRVCTWDPLTFRIHYNADHPVISGSMVIQLKTRQEVSLLLLSTEPDSAVPMQIRPGSHYVDCRIDSLPLSAGEYVVGCGMAIPNKEWLFWNANLAVLTVCPRDVYKSGLAPVAPRSFLAISHSWEVE
jgi:lipopolysaccharide transport system ATP-binding protein